MTHSAEQYKTKIQVLMAHNLIFIESGLAGNVTYVLQGMGSEGNCLHDGFNELKFWFSEGVKCGAMPPVLYKHIMRYVERGIVMTRQGEAA